MLKYNVRDVSIFESDKVDVKGVVSQDDLLRVNKKKFKTKLYKSGLAVMVMGTGIVYQLDKTGDLGANEVSLDDLDNGLNSIEDNEGLKVVKADVKVLSAVHKSSDVDVVSEGNKLVYNVDKGEEVFSPIGGIVKEKGEDFIIINDTDSGLELKIVGLDSKDFNDDLIEVGSVLGYVINDGVQVEANLVIDGNDLEVDLHENEEISNIFNYNDSILNSRDNVKFLADEVKNHVKDIEEEYKSSKVLKGVEIENINQASLLESESIYYSEFKLPLSILKGGKANVSDNVRALEGVVREVLRDKDMEDYTEAFLAILQKESGGAPHIVNGDVAQSSQYASGKIGSISNVKESIKAGVEAFVNALESTNMFDDYDKSGDVRFAIQSYNFGNALGKASVEDGVGYNVSYVQEKAKEYRISSEKNGIELMVIPNDWRGDFKYGDFTYVAKYFNIFTPSDVEKKLENADVLKKEDVEYVSVKLVEDEVELASVEGETGVAEASEEGNDDKGIESVEEVESDLKGTEKVEETEKSVISDDKERLLSTGTFSKYFEGNVASMEEEILNIANEYSNLTVDTPTNGKALDGIVVYLDAGHGGKPGTSYTCNVKGTKMAGDSGALAGNGMREADINFEFYKEAKIVLENMGAEVVSSRDGDYFVCLNDRLDGAVKANADVFVSLHSNSNDYLKARGVEVLYREGDANSLKLAELVNKYSANEALYTLQQRGLKPRNYYNPETGLYIMRGDIPTVLFETGFVNNPYDLGVITNSNAQKSVGNGIGVALAEYFGREAYEVEEKDIEEENIEDIEVEEVEEVEEDKKENEETEDKVEKEEKDEVEKEEKDEVEEGEKDEVEEEKEEEKDEVEEEKVEEDEVEEEKVEKEKEEVEVEEKEDKVEDKGEVKEEGKKAGDEEGKNYLSSFVEFFK